MKVMIAGIDGYLGWILAMRLTNRGHEVFGINNFSRRKNVREVGFKPTHTLDEELEITLATLMRFKERIEAKRDRILPTIYWRR